VDVDKWVVVKKCPECGYEREIPLDTWLTYQIERRLNSYCERTGKDVYMRYTGWKEKEMAIRETRYGRKYDTEDTDFSNLVRFLANGDGFEKLTIEFMDIESFIKKYPAEMVDSIEVDGEDEHVVILHVHNGPRSDFESYAGRTFDAAVDKFIDAMHEHYDNGIDVALIKRNEFFVATGIAGD